MNPHDFPALMEFFPSWFHEDFEGEVGDDLKAVREFLISNPDSVVKEVRAELVRFIDLPLTESEMLRVLYDDFHSHHYIPEAAQTRAWLRRILGAMDKN